MRTITDTSRPGNRRAGAATSERSGAERGNGQGQREDGAPGKRGGAPRPSCWLCERRIEPGERVTFGPVHIDKGCGLFFRLLCANCTPPSFLGECVIQHCRECRRPLAVPRWMREPKEVCSPNCVMSAYRRRRMERRAA